MVALDETVRRRLLPRGTVTTYDVAILHLSRRLLLTVALIVLGGSIGGLGRASWLFVARLRLASRLFSGPGGRRGL